MMRIGVTGGRHFDSMPTVAYALSQLPVDAVLVHGAAPGADSLCAEWWGDIHGRLTEPHPALWDGPCSPSCAPGHRRPVLGVPDRCPAAGPLRNQAMADSGLDLLVAFSGGRGTTDMMRRARFAGVPVVEL